MHRDAVPHLLKPLISQYLHKRAKHELMGMLSRPCGLYALQHSYSMSTTLMLSHTGLFKGAEQIDLLQVEQLGRTMAGSLTQVACI